MSGYLMNASFSICSEINTIPKISIHLSIRNGFHCNIYYANVFIAILEPQMGFPPPGMHLGGKLQKL